MMDRVDVAIVGAGPVGAALAALLVPAGRQVRVLEARSAPSRDTRTLALSQASRELLEEAGGWPSAGVTPIADIHVSQKGGPGRTLITAADQGLAALGYTVAYAALEEELEARLVALGASVSWGTPCEAIELDAQSAKLRLANGKRLEARLLVLADGGANARRIPGLAYSEKDYGQVAITGPVHTDRPHRGRAYERFTPQGPVALLPVGERYALVWTAAPAEAERILALEDAQFLARLQAHFGDRAGRFVGAGPRAAFPLRLRTINSTIALRTVIAGNAAQAMHPIAGQGLNVGLRDAASLVAILAAGGAPDPGDCAVLEAYRHSRRRDAGRGVAFTDFLVGAFMDERRLPTLGRGLALSVLDIIPPARRWLADRMIHGATSR
ncbi:MAG: FAD-dependent monooxygenase [Betaproteobacteria bacterium]|nr:FAD-dependent monooxygenase [Betaproteobacteria bacterium]